MVTVGYYLEEIVKKRLKGNQDILDMIKTTGNPVVIDGGVDSGYEEAKAKAIAVLERRVAEDKARVARFANPDLTSETPMSRALLVLRELAEEQNRGSSPG